MVLALTVSQSAHWAGPLGAFFQVVLIDLTLAGDNAVAIGVAAAGLPREQQRRAIVLGLAAAVVMLGGFALIAVKLLKLTGLLLAGGLLLLWVCWRAWRDLRARERERDAIGEATLEGRSGPPGLRPKTLLQAFAQILIADVSMSLDNVLAVAGAAREYPQVLVFGLVLSITLTGLAAAWIARLLHRAPWLGYLGLAIVFYVASHMIWQGSLALAADVGRRAPAAHQAARQDAPPNRSAQAATSASSIFLNRTSGTVTLPPGANRSSSPLASSDGQVGGQSSPTAKAIFSAAKGITGALTLA